MIPTPPGSPGSLGSSGPANSGEYSRPVIARTPPPLHPAKSKTTPPPLPPQTPPPKKHMKRRWNASDTFVDEDCNPFLDDCNASSAAQKKDTGNDDDKDDNGRMLVYVYRGKRIASRTSIDEDGCAPRRLFASSSKKPAMAGPMPMQNPTPPPTDKRNKRMRWRL